MPIPFSHTINLGTLPPACSSTNPTQVTLLVPQRQCPTACGVPDSSHPPMDTLPWRERLCVSSPAQDPTPNDNTAVDTIQVQPLPLSRKGLPPTFVPFVVKLLYLRRIFCFFPPLVSNHSFPAAGMPSLGGFLSPQGRRKGSLKSRKSGSRIPVPASCQLVPASKRISPAVTRVKTRFGVLRPQAGKGWPLICGHFPWRYELGAARRALLQTLPLRACMSLKT